MSGNISWVIELSVNNGKADEVPSLMTDMVAAVEAESGTLAYEWFRGDDGIHVYERFADSDAALVHLGAFAENFAERFMSVVTPTRLSVMGNASAALKEGLAQLGAVHYSPIGGFGPR